MKLIEVEEINLWDKEELSIIRAYYFKRVDIGGKLEDRIRSLFLHLLF